MCGPADITGVLTVGLFDGIGALRVASDVIGWNVVGHVSVEKSPQASRVVESKFPNSLVYHDVADITESVVQEWSLKFSQVGLILLGAGPPCQGVSGLNAGRKGALKDERSRLFFHVSRVRTLLRKAFPWAQVRSLMESVASMDAADRQTMTDDFGETPCKIDAVHLCLARRPRLYWVDWELQEGPGAIFSSPAPGRQVAKLHGDFKSGDYLLPGWQKCSTEPFPTFTTSRPRDTPGYKPAGVHNCSDRERQRWVEDRHHDLSSISIPR